MKFELTILGSSSALPTAERFATAHVLNVHERFYLIDCAEGTQMQLRKYRIPMGRIHHIFISHFHGDHYYGLFGLLSSLNLMGRKVPLHIYGPSELETLLKQMTPAGESYLFPVVFHPHRYDNQSLMLDTGSLKVFSFPLDHKIPTVGFLFRETEHELNIRKEKISELNLGIKDILQIKAGEDYLAPDGKLIPNHELTLPPPVPRSYAFCSDTRYNPDYVPYIQNVSLLYHEATYGHQHIERAKATRHSTAREAAIIARDARADQLVIGHFSARYKSLDPFLEEAREVFPSTIAASDGLTISIPWIKPKDH